MKKLANGGGFVYVQMTPGEFLTIAKIQQAGVKDGDEFSVAWIKKLADIVDLNKEGLQSIAKKSIDVATAINEVLK
jgi:hypothetical protein